MSDAGISIRRPIELLLLPLLLLAFSASVLAAGPVYRIEVAGLSCPFCAYGIEKKLGQIEGVESVETEIKEGAVFVTMEEGESLPRKRVETAIEDAGFRLKGFEAISSGG